MRRIRATVAYDGTDYHGWQSQPGLVTVQQTIEDALARVEGKPVELVASGRTDAGVHAHGQVAAFSLENPMPHYNLRKVLNRMLPPDIRILECRDAARETFHPRFDAIAKTYEYRIHRGEVCPPMLQRYVYHHPFPLSEDLMTAAAPLFEGTHDFRSFAAKNPKASDDKVRTVFSSRAEWRPEESLWIYRVRGSGFLKYMVRNIVGVLLQVGMGNITQAGVLARLDARNRIPSGPTVAPSGLALVSVEYPEALE
jgi:tRNA pseudouridine38-40 synthase